MSETTETKEPVASVTPEELAEQRAKVLEDARALTQEAKAEGVPDPVSTEAGVVERLKVADELHAKEQEMRAAEKIAAEREQVKEVREQILADSAQRTKDQPSAKRPTEASFDERVLRAMDGDHFNVAVDVAREHRFQKSVTRSGLSRQDVAQMAASPNGAQQLRALGIATDAAGGYLLDDHLNSVIYEGLRHTQSIQAAGAEVFMTSGVGDLELPIEQTVYRPGQTAQNITDSITDEGEEITENTQTFGQIVLKNYKFTSRLDLSHEVLADNATNLTDYVARRLAEIVGEKCEIAFTLGNGTDKPKGLIDAVPAANTTDSTFVATGANATSTPTYQELVQTIGALDPRYVYNGGSTGMGMNMGVNPMQMPGGKWIMSTDVFHRIVADVSSTDGHPIHQLATVAMPFHTILGRPVCLSGYFPEYGNAANIAAFGDFFRGYVIRFTEGFRIQSSNHLKFDQQQVVFIADQRADGKIRDRNAYQVLRTKT